MIDSRSPLIPLPEATATTTGRHLCSCRHRRNCQAIAPPRRGPRQELGRCSLLFPRYAGPLPQHLPPVHIFGVGPGCHGSRNDTMWRKKWYHHECRHRRNCQAVATPRRGPRQELGRCCSLLFPRFAGPLPQHLPPVQIFGVGSGCHGSRNDTMWRERERDQRHP